MQNREPSICRPSVGGTAEKEVKSFNGAWKQTVCSGSCELSFLLLRTFLCTRQ
jgi:hypothetical protein